MREERMFVRPFEELQVMEYRSLMQVNEHAQAEIRGQIPFQRMKDYVEEGKERLWVQAVIVSEGSESILFYGILEEMQMEVKSGLCIMRLLLRSGTSLMDYEKKTRSFQSGDLTYSELLNACNSGYDQAARIMTAARGEAIRRFIMQYQETDWDFIKRLAGMNHTVVVADCSTPGEKYYFGLPDRKETVTAAPDEYRTWCDMEEYASKKANGLSISPGDTISCVWESRDIYKLGEWGIIDGKKLYIWKIETVTKGNELYHTYYMKPRAGLQTPVTYNASLAGVSLLGRVTDVKEEKIQIELYDDENRANAGKRWFPYATVYSSPDGTGWYCMPEKGDQARLYFPSSQENTAYAAGAYHEEGADLRTRPECKFWRNREGKEIRLSPDRILITNNNGTYMELTDEDGIEIVSAGSISIRAKRTLSVASEDASVELTAPDRIRLKQGDTEMDLGGSLRMQGRKILL